jgi:hypothetical protein
MTPQEQLALFLVLLTIAVIIGLVVQIRRTIIRNAQLDEIKNMIDWIR